MKKEKQVVVPCNYYIIKLSCDKGKRTYYKIGNTMYMSRCENLIKTYESHDNNVATLIAFKELPHNNHKRLSDTTIREHLLLEGSFKTVDQKAIEGCIHSTDGYTEFMELDDDSVDVVEKVAEIVKGLSHSKYYTIDNVFDMVLDYSQDKKHLVNSSGLEILFNRFDTLEDRIYGNVLNNILLIGQFDFDFVASIACYHNVVLWHDSEEQKHYYTYDRINNHITYVDKFEEILKMCANKGFDLVISNPPYKKNWCRNYYECNPKCKTY